MKKNTNTVILGYYLLHPIMENLCGQKLNDFTMNNFLQAIGFINYGISTQRANPKGTDCSNRV